MKRNALKWSAGLIAGFATLLASCGTDYKIDTVLQLDKADVTAVAYPGVNMISWEPIASAQGYTVYVYEEDVYKGTLTPTNGANSVFDTDIANDIEYTYYVQAKSNSDPAANVPRSVVVENSIGSDSVTAIVPPIGTKALDLVAYEDGYDGEVLTPDTEEDEYILTADRVKTFVNGSGLVVSFPAKAYLSYDFKLYNKALDHVFNTKKSDGNVSINSNNVVAQKNFTGFGGGKYQLVVEVSAKGLATTNGINPAYDTTELVIGDVEIAKLVLKNDPALVDPRAYYVYRNTSNDVVRITLPRARKADGSAVPADWYKVYRSTDGAYETTEITSTKNKILDDESTTWAYYIDDKVPDVNVSYTYYMVLTDGKSYSDLKTTTLEVKANVNGVDKSQVSATGSQDYDKDYNPISGGVEWTILASHNNDVNEVKATDIKAYVVLGENGRLKDTEMLASEIRAKGKDVSENIASTTHGGFVVRTVTQGGITGTPVHLLVVVNEAGKKEASHIATAYPWFK